MEKQSEMIIDFITGKKIPDIGSEANRQAVERLLAEEKGFAREAIEVDVPITLTVAGEPYHSKIDLAVRADGKRFMLIKCAAGSLGSREREILAAARILDTFQIPFCAVSDGKTAILLDTVSGKRIGEGTGIIPSKNEAEEKSNSLKPMPFPKERLEREKLIFRTYNSMDVNRT
jgi:hypothetical protein